MGYYSSRYSGSSKNRTDEQPEPVTGGLAVTGVESAPTFRHEIDIRERRKL
ncbi:hypothetical protein [Streptococcus hyointestinalis]|nr:hypothetical protein [Streptococcus hyointestinalis]